jgi:hypothetical protein
MESQRLVDYIREQTTAGYSETTLRQHLLQYGWSPAVVANAFKTYRQSLTPKKSLKSKAKKLRRGGKLAKKTWGKRIQLALSSVVVVALVVAGTYFWLGQRDLKPVSSVAKSLSYAEKQTFDVNTVGGAISQFSADNSGLPSALTVSTDGSLVLCGVDCAAIAVTIAPLQTYQPSNVKLIPFESGFTTTDKAAMYLIPGAKCADTHTLGGENPNPRSMVIMYARENGLGVTPYCVTL